MKLIDVVQGTPEWLKARCGMPTASNFDYLITTKGEPSKQREKYLFRLAGETIIGNAEETYTNGAMERGKIMEAEARQAYELITGNNVLQVGLCVSDDGSYGASPDGLVDDDGVLEIKCPTLSVHISYLLANELPTDYFQQTQGELFVTGRKWLDFVSYYPNIKPLIIRVFPDKSFHKALDKALKVFCVDLEECINKIK